MPEIEKEFDLEDKNSEKISWRDKFGLECYGAKINIKTDNLVLRSKLREYLPNIMQKEYFGNLSDNILFLSDQDQNKNGLYFNDEPAMSFKNFDDTFYEFAADKILMIMATISLPRKIYLHSGAVVWNDLGILIPGKSRSGKTTLVKEFIKAGADYYSDDCIILDDKNNMLPFPKALSIRKGNGKVLREASYFGAEVGHKKVKVNLILFASYRKNGVWKAQSRLPGESVLKLMDNFYLRASVGNAPSEIIKILTNLTKQAALYGGERGDASQVIEWVSREFLA